MMRGGRRGYARALEARAGLASGVPVRPGFFQIKIPSDFRDMLVGQWISGIGKYYVLRTLGTGGMSVVYAAKHLESKKIYAVKTLRMQAASDELTVRWCCSQYRGGDCKGKLRRPGQLPGLLVWCFPKPRDGCFRDAWSFVPATTSEVTTGRVQIQGRARTVLKTDPKTQ